MEKGILIAEKILMTVTNDKFENGELKGAKVASEAFESVKKLRINTEKSTQLLKRAMDIMDFHSARCPLNPKTNFSGSEEHLSEYRKVMDEIKNFLSS